LLYFSGRVAFMLFLYFYFAYYGGVTDQAKVQKTKKREEGNEILNNRSSLKGVATEEFKAY